MRAPPSEPVDGAPRAKTEYYVIAWHTRGSKMLGTKTDAITADAGRVAMVYAIRDM